MQKTETGVPGENNQLTPSHWQLSYMPQTTRQYVP